MINQNKRKQLIKELKKVVTDLEEGYDGFMFLYDIVCKPQNAVFNISFKDIIDTMDKVKALYDFYKQHKAPFFIMARKNGKTHFAYSFIKNYEAIIQAYSAAEKEIEKNLKLEE